MSLAEARTQLAELVERFPDHALAVDVKRKPWIKLFNWEFWPTVVLYFPVAFLHIYYGIRCGTPFFYTWVNPKIHHGGMFGASKKDIHAQLPQEKMPKTLELSPGDRFEESKEWKQISQVNFPLIIKPHMGARGNGIQMIYNEAELRAVTHKLKFDASIQEYNTDPLELGVFYVRLPHWEKGKITSLMVRKMTFVVGDGKSTVRELIKQHGRLRLYTRPIFRLMEKEDLERVPKGGEKYFPIRIGNHNKGTMFLSADELISAELEATFDQISKSVPEFYFGRYDVKCRSWKDLEQGNFTIIELNGALAEPTAVYHPGASIANFYQTVFRHHNWMGQIAISNKRNHKGVAFLKSWADLRRFQRDSKAFEEQKS